MTKQLSASQINQLIHENERLKQENKCLRRLTSSKRYQFADRIACIYNNMFPLDTKRRALSIAIGTPILTHHARKRLKKQAKIAQRIQQLIDGHNKIIAIHSIDYDTKLKQRPHHLADGFAKLGYFVIYIEPANFAQPFRKINADLVTINDYHLLQNLQARHKYFIQPSTTAIPLLDLQDIQSWGYQVIYDYIDELDEDISGDISVQLKIWDNLKDINPVLNIATAHKLADDLSAQLGRSAKNIILAPNAVNLDHFNYQIKSNDNIPSDLRKVLDLGHPVIGFYGALAAWIDFDLIHQVAQHHPEWEIVLIGTDYEGALRNLHSDPNVHYLGSKNYDELINYAQHFDCAILPFQTGKIAKATSPVKLFEYMAAGLPTVCTRDLDECRGYDYVYMAKDAKDFERKLAQAIADKQDPKKRARLLAQAKDNTWDKRVAAIDKALLRAVR